MARPALGHDGVGAGGGEPGGASGAVPDVRHRDQQRQQSRPRRGRRAPALGWLPDGWPDLGPRHPGESFPLERAWAWEDDGTATADDPRIDAVFTHGSIVLGTADGPMFWLLVTTGPRRGEVWTVSEVGATPAPIAGVTSFEDWVRHWASENELTQAAHRRSAGQGLFCVHHDGLSQGEITLAF